MIVLPRVITTRRPKEVVLLVSLKRTLGGTVNMKMLVGNSSRSRWFL